MSHSITAQLKDANAGDRANMRDRKGRKSHQITEITLKEEHVYRCEALLVAQREKSIVTPENVHRKTTTEQKETGITDSCSKMRACVSVAGKQETSDQQRD